MIRTKLCHSTGSGESNGNTSSLFLVYPSPHSPPPPVIFTPPSCVKYGMAPDAWRSLVLRFLYWKINHLDR